MLGLCNMLYGGMVIKYEYCVSSFLGEDEVCNVENGVLFVCLGGNGIFVLVGVVFFEDWCLNFG